VAVRRRERRVAVDADLVHPERQLALDGGDDRPHLPAEVAAVPAVEGDPEHRLCRERLTPRRPSSTDDGSARQDLGAAFLLRPTPSFAPGGSNIGWPPVTCCALSGSPVKW